VMYLCYGVSILSLSMILMFDFGIVPTVFFFSFYYHIILQIIEKIQMSRISALRTLSKEH
jgi:hypothetical protein